MWSIKKELILLCLLSITYTFTSVSDSHTTLKTYINIIYQLSRTKSQSRDFVELYNVLQNTDNATSLVVTKSAIKKPLNY